MYRFLVESTKIENATFPMLRQIEWGVQNRPITKNGVLLVTTLSFQKICFSLRTSKKGCFYILTTKMSILILFEIVGVSFESACVFFP